MSMIGTGSKGKHLCFFVIKCKREKNEFFSSTFSVEKNIDLARRKKEKSF